MKSNGTQLSWSSRTTKFTLEDRRCHFQKGRVQKTCVYMGPTEPSGLPFLLTNWSLRLRGLLSKPELVGEKSETHPKLYFPAPSHCTLTYVENKTLFCAATPTFLFQFCDFFFFWQHLLTASRALWMWILSLPSLVKGFFLWNKNTDW